MTHDEPVDGPPDDTTGGDGRPASTPVQVGVAVAGLAEAWLRDTVLAGVGLFSFVVMVCGFTAAEGAGYAVLGLVAGSAGFALPTVALVRRAGPSRIWLTLLAGAVVDAAALALVLTGWP